MSDELRRLLDAVQKQLEKEDLLKIIVDFDEWWCPTATTCLSSLYDLADNPEGLREKTRSYHEERKREYRERRYT